MGHNPEKKLFISVFGKGDLCRFDVIGIYVNEIGRSEMVAEFFYPVFFLGFQTKLSSGYSTSLFEWHRNGSVLPKGREYPAA